jgi:hypothetical protein
VCMSTGSGEDTGKAWRCGGLRNVLVFGFAVFCGPAECQRGTGSVPNIMGQRDTVAASILYDL